jgi:hypothetical protein
MGEAGHRIGRMGGSAIGQRAHHVRDLRRQPVDRIAYPKAEIRRHLIVAAARGVQSATGLADTLGEAGLYVHVDVLERHVEREATGLDLLRDRR